MDSDHQRKIDEIMYETNNKINAIVKEIRQIKFSQLTEEEKKIKCVITSYSIHYTKLYEKEF